MSNNARPPLTDPVKEAAAIRASFSAVTPTSTPSITAKTPSGAPAPTSASRRISPVRTDSSGCPGCALRTTGQPAASADAVSPPATLNANGKLLAANTSTGPIATFTRRMSGRAPIGQTGSAGATGGSRNAPSGRAPGEPGGPG